MADKCHGRFQKVRLRGDCCGVVKEGSLPKAANHMEQDPTSRGPSPRGVGKEIKKK